MPTPAELFDSAKAIAPGLISLRRELHANPEFALDLPETQARLLSEIEGLGTITLGKSLSSIALLIEGSAPGPTVLLRADMDALHISEETDLEFASTNGFMHACGHDLHMAAGVGAAKILHSLRNQLAGNVLIWFQPGEEGHSGADIMIEEGMLELSDQRPVASYGLHVFTSLPAGVIACKPGAMMASSGDMNVVFTGSGGHASMPWLSKDPVAPMVSTISSLQSMLNTNFDQFDPVILNVSWIEAGDSATNNVIPDSASFGATVRTFSEASTNKLHDLAPKLIQSIAAGFGVSAEVEFSTPTKVLLNDSAAVSKVETIAKSLVGEAGYLPMESPIAGGEDFASISHEIPGAFVFLGACPAGIDHATAPTNHSAKAVFDDSVIPLGAALLASLAVAHLV